MAFRTWGRLLLTALGVSVLAGAGQLGIAYGFGVVRLDGAFVDDSVNRWPAQLAWVGWFAAVATVAGAVLTERLARRDTASAGTTEVLSIAGVSGLGAIVVAPLCMQPARAAELGGSVDPVWAVGICAILGAVVGAGAAIAVLLRPPFGWSIVLTAAAVWLLALVSVAPSVASTGTLPTVRLGVLEPSWLDPAAAQRLAMLLLPTLALLAGAAVGALARRAGYLPVVGGAAGAAGPVLLAFAYLTAGPGTAADRYQLAPYYGALIAVAAGALGSTATTVLPRPVTTAAGPDAIEPTDILQPLPPSPATHDATPPASTTPATARAVGAPSPAHWDWPAAGGLTPAPVPAGLTRRPLGRPGPERPADRDEPTHGYGSVPAGERSELAAEGSGPAVEGSGPAVEGSGLAAEGPGLAGKGAASGPEAVRHPLDAMPTAEASPSVAGAVTGRAPVAHDAGRPAAEPGATADGITARHLAPEPDDRPAQADVTPGVAHELTADRPRFEPAFSAEQGPDVARRDRSDDSGPGQLPGSPPPGRRTSAIDVLAAGRPTPPVEPDPVTPPAPSAEPPHPAAASAEATTATHRSEASSVDPGPVTPSAPTTRSAHRATAHAEATGAPGRTDARPVAPDPAPDRPESQSVAPGSAPDRTEAPSVAPNPAPDRTEAAAAAERQVAVAAPAEPATEAAPTRATRSKRSRAATPAPRSADHASRTTRSADDVPAGARAADDVPAKGRAADDVPGKGHSAGDVPAKTRPADGTPSATRPKAAPAPAPAIDDALPTAGSTGDAPSADRPAGDGTRAAGPEAAGESAPATAGRARRTRKPRTSRSAPEQAATEPATTTSDSTAAPTATTPDTTAEPATTRPDSTVKRAGSKRDSGFERAGSTPDDTFERAGTAPVVAETPADARTGPTGADEPARHVGQRHPARETRAAGVPEAPTPADPSGGGTPAAGERRSFFFDPEPVPAELPEPPASPRPRIPMFEDTTPNNVRPAWPVAPAPNWPVTPRGTEQTAPGTPTTGRTGDGTGSAGATRPEPAPRPRHRALPDLGRSTGWDALANARPAGPPAPPPTGPTPEATAPVGGTPEPTGHIGGTPEATGRPAETNGSPQQSTGGTDPAPGATRPILPPWDGPAPEVAGSAPGRHADLSRADATTEAAGGKSKARRSLFRRNRGKGAEAGEADRESEPIAAQDEEYVDWVAGLASDDNADDARSLRTGRHHRD
ncbi:hypothetical protein ACFFMM_16520 [Micromonospora chaiyaphumensis]|uniref:ABC-type Mn2+/Zn2+ transport system, permease component n=1 Tax=Micromonospora chaiyaphumensis TaxID=307119 RepID=A0A1C4WTV4_9ACTN|nr:hypothetical protein [Micromonospora chaiyaphumensis]SCE99594.1 ABC-type Mn2+/Zn2+ transport system, permease component [Micromonospora chaiyaphumensis]